MVIFTKCTSLTDRPKLCRLMVPGLRSVRQRAPQPREGRMLQASSYMPLTAWLKAVFCSTLYITDATASQRPVVL